MFFVNPLRLADDIKWTADPGSAFLAQQGDVMEDDSGINQYAQKIISAPGKKDGLYRKNADETWHRTEDNWPVEDSDIIK